MLKTRFYKCLFLIVSLSLLNTINAQQNSGGVPVSFLKEDAFSALKSETPEIILPSLDNKKEKERAREISNSKCEGCKNNYYGRSIDVSINIKKQGRFKVLEDESKLWTIKLKSSTAYGMELFFDNFKLPEGSTLYIFNEERTSLLGGYTSSNNPKDESKLIKFATEYIAGKNIYLEYHEPSNSDFEGVISITKVIHVFEDIFSKSLKNGPYGASGSCNINVACPEGDDWANEINSVALILALDQNFDLASWCSGSLINNTNEDGKPYFLTAKHCIGGTSQHYDYTTWRFLFNHQTTTCSSDGSDVSQSINQSIYGSTLLSKDGPGLNSPTTDYLLLELNTSADVLKNIGVCYAGWTLEEENNPPFVGIHHPRGDVKKISIDKDYIEATSYYNTLPNQYNNWMVNWDYGTTEGGSSGSPLFDSKHRIIGQLQGGEATCNGEVNNGDYDWYGRFNMSYDIGGFSYWLDPYSTGKNYVDTYCLGEYDIISGTPSNNYPNYCKSPSNLKNGFHINSDNDINNVVTEVCINENIILTPFEEDDCIAYFPVTTERHCSKCNDPNAYECSIAICGCMCDYKKLWISLTLCDINLSPVSPEYASWQYFTYSSPSNVTSFNLNDYLISGINFHSGQIYKLKLATVSNGTWQEYTRYIHFYEDQVNINGLNNSYNIYGADITIQNSTISQPVEVVANNSIKILSETTLNKGHYYIDETINCSSFKSKSNKNLIIDEDKIVDKTENRISKVNHSNISTSNHNDEVNVSPNPTTGIINIDIDAKLEGIVELELKDLMGNIIFKKIENKNSFRFDVSKYPKGIYILTTKIGTRLNINKIIHQ